MARADTAEPRAGAGATMTAPPGVPPTVEVDPDRRSYYLELFLVSLAGILLEISYTRVVSFKLYYYYTYLVIGLALLGIGFGGVLVTISPRLRRVATASLMMWSLVIGAVTVGVGYLVIAAIPVDTFAIWNYQSFDSVVNLALLLTICLGLVRPVRRDRRDHLHAVRAPARAHRPPVLRRPDRRRARLRDRRAAPRLRSVPPPRSSSPGCSSPAAGLRLAIRSRSRVVPCAGILAAVLAIGGRGAVGAPRSPPRRRASAATSRRDTIYSKWSPIFRVDVDQASPDVRVLYHDGLIGSAIYRWDGDDASLGDFGFDTDIRAFPFATLGDAAGAGDDHRRGRRARGARLALLRRRAHRRHRAEPGHLPPRHRRLRRLHRPHRRATRR